MKPWRKQFGIWVPDKRLSDERGFISPGVIGAVAGSRRRTSGGSSIALLANTQMISQAGGGSGTSPAINTTGASLLIVVLVDIYNGGTTLSDSAGNTWVTAPPTARTPAVSQMRTRIYYCANPATSSSHTFTATGTGIYFSLCVGAFSNTSASPYIAENGSTNASSVTSIGTGSVTPSSDGSLVIASLGTYGGAASIDSSFTISDQTTFNGGRNYKGAMAYLVQTTAVAVSPTWSWSGASPVGAGIAVFK